MTFVLSLQYIMSDNTLRVLTETGANQTEHIKGKNKFY